MQLDDDQSKALLDILSHHEVYEEIQDFRFPGALDGYGPPFEARPSLPSSSPSLQAIVNTFFTTLPGMRDVPQEFWNKQIGPLINELEKAELSESYDKGTLGIRKTLATAIAALFEYVMRGIYAGFNRPDASLDAASYDSKSADDLQNAFRDCMQQAVYGDLLNQVFDKTAETDKLADHSPLIQASHEFGLVNLASFLHFTLIKSPKGQQLLTLIDHANKLVPYTIVRQTLKIGNVASMINAMMKVILAKMSMTSVTNWIGLTQSADEGMNLMQNIIAQVLNWDIRDFKSRALKIEKSKDGPSKEQLSTLRGFLQKTRQEHLKIRDTSIEQAQSLPYVVLRDAGVRTEMSESAHRLALEYLSIQLSIRDRQEIIRVLCHSTPDHLTQSIRDLVAAYEPLIRSIHNSVDLSDTVYDFEVFLRDLIRLSKIPDPSSRGSRRQSNHPPTVGDFVALLRKHQYSSHKFLHQVAKNGPDITSWFRDYSNAAASHFRQQDKPTDGAPNPGAGDLTPGLQALFDALPEPKQATFRDILSQHARYIGKLHDASAVRLRAVVSSPQTDHPALATPATSAPTSRAGSRTSSPAPVARAEPLPADSKTADPGPGAYLARWQALLDATLMTPAVPTGGRVRGTGTRKEPVRRGAADNDDSDGEDDVFADACERLDQFALDESEKVAPPDVRPLVEALGGPFRELLGQRGCTW